MFEPVLHLDSKILVFIYSSSSSSSRYLNINVLLLKDVEIQFHISKISKHVQTTVIQVFAILKYLENLLEV